MNLEQPYGDGNHKRIKWRKSWVVDREKLTATHQETGFVMAFSPETWGGYTAVLRTSQLPSFGPDNRQAQAQIEGLRQLMLDGWEIFHTAMASKQQNRP